MCVLFFARVVVKKRVVCFCDKTEKKILGEKRRRLGHKSVQK